MHLTNPDGSHELTSIISASSNKKKDGSGSSSKLQIAPKILLGIIVVSETSLLQHILRADDQKVAETVRILTPDSKFYCNY